MQIAQMVVGVTVSLAGYFYNQKDPVGCEVHPYVIKVSAVIYASYLYLVRFCPSGALGLGFGLGLV